MLPDTIIVSPLELPGHGLRIQEELLFSLDDMVEDLQLQIAQDNPRRFAFFGHSMGGYLAYLLSLRLHQESKPLPIHLLVSSNRSPSRPVREAGFHLLPETELIKQLQDMGGSQPGFFTNRDLLDLFIPILRADFHALSDYSYQSAAPLPIPMTILWGNVDNIKREEVQCWQLETSIDLNLIERPGGHFFILDQFTEIAQIICAALLVDVE